MPTEATGLEHVTPVKITSTSATERAGFRKCRRSGSLPRSIGSTRRRATSTSSSGTSRTGTAADGEEAAQRSCRLLVAWITTRGLAMIGLDRVTQERTSIVLAT